MTPPVHDGMWVEQSAALSMAQQPRDSIATRKIAFLVAPGVSSKNVEEVRSRLQSEGALVEVVVEVLGTIPTAEGSALTSTGPPPAWHP